MGSSAVIGVGIDIEWVGRFQDARPRAFTEREIAYCNGQANPAESYAGRWCAKEAVIKALWSRVRLIPSDIEIVAGTDGVPRAQVRDAPVDEFVLEVSISHTADFAVAFAVAFSAAAE